MHKQKYYIYEKAKWKNKYNILLSLTIISMAVVYSSSFLPLPNIVYSTIICIGFIISTVIAHCIFNDLFFKSINEYIHNEKAKTISAYSTSKLAQTIKITYFIPYLTGFTCALDIILVLLLGETKESFSFPMLLTQFFYFLSLAAYKGYFIDLIIAFGKDSFVSGLYTVKYANIAKIEEKRRIHALQDTVVIFNVLDKNNSIVGYDKLPLSDYLFLCQRIGNM